MSAADTFARFADVVADALDDHHLDGDAIAGRAHMSRSHFDRVVAAASVRRQPRSAAGSRSSAPRTT
ncbi:MAG: hypothetical protein M3419_11165 [Actinomycetota bacterium]|nr:hypothetical protein [Actinomycetota bacterium]